MRSSRSDAWAHAQGPSRYIIHDEKTQKVAVVDPYDPTKLQAAADKEGLVIGEYLLLTHHHQDHSGGNEVSYSTLWAGAGR